MFWRNGTAQYLSDGTRHAQANSVFVSEGNIFIAGWEANPQGREVATLWRNGIAQRLSGRWNASRGTPGIIPEGATSVFVSDNDVFVTGWDGAFATVWKNGAIQHLNDGRINHASAFSVFVFGNDVFITGWEGNTITFWENGDIHFLSDGSRLAVGNDIFVTATGDVFIAGFKTKVLESCVFEQN
jgi:hypothetical protein